jgi:transposase
VYHMLRHKEEYVDQGATYYEEQYRKRAIKNLERKAAWLGMKVVPAAT